MKYNAQNTPIVCMLSDSKCYKNTHLMTVRGVLWHSTGANNPNLSRYVQPADNDPNKEYLLSILGKNKYNNDYNHGSKERSMGVNAWIGKLVDGTVATVQTMPWAYAPWGCGGGSKGSCNDGWVQFEIEESDLTDPIYAQAVYNEACELTAFLCTMYHLDPFGTVKFKGIDVPVILDHKESHRLGLGNNHGDVQHWFPKILGKSLIDIRRDVANLMEDISIPAEYNALMRGAKGEAVKEVQSRLIALGYDLGRWGADGDFGTQTVKAVSEFQADHLLPITGIVDEKTMAALEDAQTIGYTVTIRGLNAAQVQILQEEYPGCEVEEE